MHDHHLLVEQRLARVLFERILPNCYSDSVPLTVQAWAPAGEPLPVTAARAALSNGRFVPFEIGRAYGIPWSTTWFHCTATVPKRWAGCAVEALINLGFGLSPGFQAEGLVWGPDGPLRALNPLNHAISLLDSAVGGEQFEFLVEAAANPQIGERRYEPSPMGSLATAPPQFQYILKQAELTVFHAEVAELVHDLDVLGGLIKELPLNGPRRPQITRAIERALDTLDLDNVIGTATAGRGCLAEVLAKPAVPSAHRISAIGHAHIDTAWLWPLRETVRKCARTFSNALNLMRSEPDLIFACSQAQQYEWMREKYPSVFAEIATRVADGRFVPVGGMWVEADMNLPSGESLARQFLHGQSFFHEQYGIICEEVWIPDVFGYPASMPQIFRLGGTKWFLTQKLSWNKQNRMPHHTMWWEGINGSRIFTHFPPVDTYNVAMEPAQLAHAERNYADHGGGTMSMAPFGFGNGGGGPTREMMARYRRMRDLEGLPRVIIETPAQFFAAAEADYPDAPTWSGELYFETHRGTYTSQANTKLGNRRAEELLGEVELWSSLAAAAVAGEFPAAALRRLWREILTLQFHDIIPGSSIAWVYADADAAYHRILAELADLRRAALTALAPTVGGQVLLANPTSFPSAAVVQLAADLADGQRLSDGRVAVRITPIAPMTVTGMNVAGMTAKEMRTANTAATRIVQARRTPDGEFALTNELVTATISAEGMITSFIDRRVGREIVKSGAVGNLLELCADHPVEYDAWDLDQHYTANTVALVALDSIEIIDGGPLVASVRVVRRFGASRIEQLIVLCADSARLDFVTNVSWHENEKVLKVAFPVDVHTREVACDIQFGHVYRPTHASTTWDAAKFEICAHRWIDASEPGFGVALLNDAKYGYDVQRGALRLTLLRSANYPDPNADRGEHRFTYSLLPHSGSLAEVRAEAARLNQPVTVVQGSGSTPRACTAVRSSNQNVVVTAVKMAEDSSNDVIVRCYEASGGRSRSLLETIFACATVTVCNFLELPLPEEAAAVQSVAAGTIEITLKPFQILTLRFGGLR